MSDESERKELKARRGGMRNFIAGFAALGLLAATLWNAADRAATSPMLASTTSLPDVAEPVWLVLVGLVAIVALNALFVGSETAIELLRPHHAKLLKEDRPPDAGKLQTLLDGQARFAAACALGSHATRLGIILLSFVLTPATLSWASDAFGLNPNFGNLILVWIAILVPVGALHLVFGELVPKSYAVLHPLRVALLTFGFVRAASSVLSPGAMVVTAIANVLAKRFGGRASLAIPNAAEEEILTLVESAEETGEIETGEKELLKSVFDFTDKVAREIMTPRVDVDALPVRSDPMDVVHLIQETGHSRIPLYEGSDDQIVGVIHAKDLLLAMLNGKAPNIRKLMRPVLFVPENKNLYELITEMRQHRTQLAVVQDEMGGTAGIVTIEDIVEELVGDIVDEYDVEEPEVVPNAEGWLVAGRAHLDDVNEAIGAEFESEEFDTIGGYVFGMFGRQPKPNDAIDLDGYRFVVAETDGPRISRLAVAKAAGSPSENSEANGE